MEHSVGSQWNRWDLHVHTASSYDSKYGGAGADILLCKCLRDNHIVAVAITDHFLIDAHRIENLRRIAPEITFFPGVELRTNTGANNLHMILIFSEKCDVKILSADFEAKMLRSNALGKDKNETIHWPQACITQFANEYGGLISIHAGKKTNGLDTEIHNERAVPVKEAIKEEIAKDVHFFEVKSLRDIVDYDQHVFSEIPTKPVIICSDCHDPRAYETNEMLWIKGEPTFEGLKQCLFLPKERVYVGAMPTPLRRAESNRVNTIKNIAVHPREGASSSGVAWFNFDLPLNAELVAIIGNKGSGKSALADILGHMCKCRSMDKASFLCKERFLKASSGFAKQYVARIEWADGHYEEKTLNELDDGNSFETAQYLPQRYIEDACNSMGEEFQDEIDNVIFSYIDVAERGNARNLKELVARKTSSLLLAIEQAQKDIDAIVKKMIELEAKRTRQYKESVNSALQQVKEKLKRYDEEKPLAIEKPKAREEDVAYQTSLRQCDEEITRLDAEIVKMQGRISIINIGVDEASDLKSRMVLLEESTSELNEAISAYNAQYLLEPPVPQVKLTLPTIDLDATQNKLVEERRLLGYQLQGDEKHLGLIGERQIKSDERELLVKQASDEERDYQKYLAALKEWQRKRDELEGPCTKEKTVQFYQHEYDCLANGLNADYESMKQKRNSKLQELMAAKSQIVQIFESIYKPVQCAISESLGELGDDIALVAEMRCIEPDLTEKLLKYINLRSAGMFRGRAEAQRVIDDKIHETNFCDDDSIIKLMDFLSDSTQDIDNSAQPIIADRDGFYRLIYGLSYIGVSFQLKLGQRNLSELSPGERGIVLLIFYLALNKNDCPIIIDQPEDNLDNQSVYSKLVSCICKAKQKRQVIIVTHNPNIAVACDAEQIVYAHMNKRDLCITYESGAIENKDVKQHVVDVLEGTMPAFKLRQQKYEIQP